MFSVFQAAHDPEGTAVGLSIQASSGMRTNWEQ
jgi:hypothetical protein